MFKFNYYNTFIYHYYMVFVGGDNDVRYSTNSSIALNPFDCIEEIDFKEMVNYLPDNNPDKIIYLRKNRINKLLNK